MPGKNLQVTLASRPTGWVEEASVRVLKVLVNAELPVTSFRTREHDLEDAFMSVTKGRVQ